MHKRLLEALPFALGIAVVLGISVVFNIVKAQSIVADPCISPDIAKVTVVLNLSGTGAEVLPISGTTRIYTCGFMASVAGTTPSFKFRYGTGTACATGPIDLTGTILPTSGTVVDYEPDGTAFATPAGQALCAVLAGTTPSVQGVLTYVRQ